MTNDEFRMTKECTMPKRESSLFDLYTGLAGKFEDQLAFRGMEFLRSGGPVDLRDWRVGDAIHQDVVRVLRPAANGEPDATIGLIFGHDLAGGVNEQAGAAKGMEIVDR